LPAAIIVVWIMAVLLTGWLIYKWGWSVVPSRLRGAKGLHTPWSGARWVSWSWPHHLLIGDHL